MRLALIGCSWCLAMGSCSNSSVLQKEDLEHLRCKLSRLKRAETGSDWMLWVLCDNGFVFKQLCSAPQAKHRTPEMQTEQAEEQAKFSWCYGNGSVFKQLCSAPRGEHRTPEMQTEQAEKSRRTLCWL